MKLLTFLFLFFASKCFSQEEEHLKGSANQIESNGVFSVSSLSSVLQVEVYPNPAEGDFSIIAPEGATVTIYSSSGIYVGTWNVGPEGKVFLEDLSRGSYICSVMVGAEKSVKKVVVL